MERSPADDPPEDVGGAVRVVDLSEDEPYQRCKSGNTNHNRRGQGRGEGSGLSSEGNVSKGVKRSGDGEEGKTETDI